MRIILLQLFDEDTYTYTYLVGDRASGEAALIDPVIDKAVRDLQIIADLGLKLKYAGQSGGEAWFSQFIWFLN